MYLQSARQRGVKFVILLLLVIYIPVGFSAEKHDFNSIKKTIELLETRDAFKLKADELKVKINQSKIELDAYIETNQKNIGALILSVRLAIIEELFLEDEKSGDNKGQHPKEKFNAQHMTLDKALELQPESAMAHYWKAILFGTNASSSGEGSDLKQQSVDLDRAIHFSRKAMELDPENVRYREALSIYLATAGQRKEALKVMDTEATANNAIYILLKDVDAFPFPDGTIISKEDSDSYSEMQFSAKTISNYPQLRVQVAIVPMSAAKLEAFYQQKWPEFKFFSQGQSGLYAQYLAIQPNGFRPSLNISEARALAGLHSGGIIISVEEILNPTQQQKSQSPAGHKLPLSFGNEFSYLFFVNNRSIN